jgi:hypothetical protein
MFQLLWQTWSNNWLLSKGMIPLGTMRSDVIVLLSPMRNQGFSFIPGKEYLSIEQFVAHPAIE